MVLSNPDKASSATSLEGHEEAASGCRTLWLILACGAVVRLALWWGSADAPVVIDDAQDYNGLAVRLAATGRYVSASGEAVSLRPPFYPVVVAGIYKLFGSENYAAVRAFQAVLSLGTALLIYLLGRDVYTRRVGTAAAAFACFYPTLLGYNNLLLTEVLFLFLVSATGCVAVRAIQRQSLALLVVLGLLLGVGAMTRSILWLFTPVLGCYLALVWRASPGRRVLAALIPVVVFAATIAPWAWRNTNLHRTLTLIDVMGGRNAMMGNYEHTPLERSWATISIVRGEQAWFRVLQRETPNYSELTQGQIDKLAMRHGIRFVLSHPLLTAQRTAVRFFNFWQLERELIAGAAQGCFGEFSKLSVLGLAAVVCGSYSLIIFAGLFGAFCVPPTDRRLHLLFLLTILFQCAIHSAIFAHSRYHLPVMPFVFVYAAAALVGWRTVWAQRHRWPFRLAVLGCAVLVLGWLRELIMVDLAHGSRLLS